MIAPLFWSEDRLASRSGDRAAPSIRRPTSFRDPVTTCSVDPKINQLS